MAALTQEENVTYHIKHVRDIKPDELAEIKRVFVKSRLSSKYFASYFSSKAAQRQLDSAERVIAEKFDKEVKKKENSLYIATICVRERVVAVAFAERYGAGKIYLSRGGTDPEHQRGGHGRAMIQFCRETFADDVIWSYVTRKNAEAWKVWTEMGWKEVEADVLGVREHKHGRETKAVMYLPPIRNVSSKL